MTSTEDIEAALFSAERSLDAGRGLKGTGFWKAVAVLRSDGALAELYADRVAVIDRRAFERGVKLRFPLWFGLLMLVAMTLFGIAAVASARFVGHEKFFGDRLYEIVDGGRWFVPVAFLAGTIALLLGTHSLAHYVVGRIVGIRFTHTFLGGPPPPRPGVKVDYASYLRASPMSRAVMHASGAVLTKLVPFALLVASVPLYEDFPWLTWILIGIGLLQIVTDITLSTKVSDWKKVRRELRAARTT